MKPQDLYILLTINLISILILILGIVIYTKILKKRISLFGLLLLLSVLPVISIFRQGTYWAGDLSLHSVFLQSFFQNIQEGNIIPQWAGGLCGGYGCPVFLFEYTLPYYIGTIFHLFGFSYLDSIKLFLASTYILSGVTMFLFIKDEYDTTSAFFASLLYLFAPIQLIEMHFRVSVGTHVAFVFIPLTFLFAKKALNGNPIFIVLGTCNFLLLLLSHSSVTLVIIPAALIYAYLKRDNYKQIVYPLLSIILGAGLSAYYILPALYEVKYTWYSQTIKSVQDFKPFFDYLYTPGRYFFLFRGSHGEVRLIVGYVQLFVIFVATYQLFKKHFSKRERNIVIFALSYFLVCFLLMQSFTKPIWDNVFLLRSFVLPWRMLVPIAFISAFLGAIIIKNRNKKLIIMLCILTVFITFLNWGNRNMTPLDPNAFYTHWSLYTEYYEPNNQIYQHRYETRSGLSQYLVLHRPKSYLQVLSGSSIIKEEARTQVFHQYLVDAKTNVELSENTYYFPGWKVFANGKEVPINIKNPKQFGTLTFSLKKGLYLITARFEDTPIRRLGKIISLTTLIALLTLLLFKPIKNLSF